jgi:hypothetical protein
MQGIKEWLGATKRRLRRKWRRSVVYRAWSWFNAPWQITSWYFEDMEALFREVDSRIEAIEDLAWAIRADLADLEDDQIEVERRLDQVEDEYELVFPFQGSLR